MTQYRLSNRFSVWCSLSVSRLPFSYSFCPVVVISAHGIAHVSSFILIINIFSSLLCLLSMLVLLSLHISPYPTLLCISCTFLNSFLLFLHPCTSTVIPLIHFFSPPFPLLFSSPSLPFPTSLFLLIPHSPPSPPLPSPHTCPHLARCVTPACESMSVIVFPDCVV